MGKINWRNVVLGGLVGGGLVKIVAATEAGAWLYKE